MKSLIVNPGSTSRKYALYQDYKELALFHLEKEAHKYFANIKIGETSGKIEIDEKQFKAPHKHIFDLLIGNELIKEKKDIDAIAIRIVASGTYFEENRLIDKVFLNKLKEAENEEPLHITPVLEELESLEKLLPKTRTIGISDSSFHKNIPLVAKNYAISKEVAEKFEVYKFGFHGISLGSIKHKLENDSVLSSKSNIPEKTIICHLGGGSSITALLNGNSIDTSMGFSPLEGLTMATRVGDIDPGAVIYIAKKMNFSLDQLEEYFNKKCGLIGLSNNKSSDLRELIELEKKGDGDAQLAIGDFVYQIKKYIGSYTATLNGLDLLVFSGTIGERSFILRERICDQLDYLGIQINKDLNNATEEKDAFIQSENSRVKIAVIKTNETEEMVRELNQLLANN